MEVTILKQEAKPLLKFTAVDARILFAGPTPTRQEVVDALSKALKAKKELLIVSKIQMLYGEQAARVAARLYETREALEKFERERAIKKNTFAEVEKAKGEDASESGEAQSEEKARESIPTASESAPEKETAPKKESDSEESAPEEVGKQQGGEE